MLQVIKATVNGKDGYICTLMEHGKPVSIAFTDEKELLVLLNRL